MAPHRSLPLSLLLAHATLARGQSCPALSIGASAIHETASFFASWNVDSSRDRLFFDLNFSDPQFVYLATQIGAPGRIRFGGTGNDDLWYELGTAPPCASATRSTSASYECLNQTVWDSLVSLSTASGAPLIFGLNIHPANSGDSPPKGPWNATNARAALTFAKAQGAPIYGLELGNEQNTIMTATEQAAAFRVLSGVVDDVWGTSTDRPLLFGPDPHSFKDAGSALPVTVRYISDFVAAAGDILSFATHHEYIEIDADNVLDPVFLDLTRTIAQAVVAGVRNVSATVGIVAGEIGPHNGGTYGPGGVTPNCAGNKVCGRFGSALWYADSMATKAAAGYALYCRQDIIGADYGLINSTSLAPSADYWLLVLWKRLIGSKVLAVSGLAPPSTTRAYAFCAAPSAAATATLVLINLANASACVGLPAGFAQPGVPLTQYSLTPGAGGVTSAGTLLNGATLALGADGTLPSLVGKSVPQAGGVALPPVSVTLLTVPLAAGFAGACS
jgi:heparanase 1